MDSSTHQSVNAIEGEQAQNQAQTQILTPMPTQTQDAPQELKIVVESTSIQTTQSSQNLSSESGVSDICRKKRSMKDNWHVCVTDTQGGSNTEFNIFLKEDVEQDKSPNFSILGWWKANSHRFLIFFKMTKDILVIPISTVASESAFSTGGHVLDSFGSSLTLKMVQALICSQDWLHSSKQSIAIEENLDALETIEKEFTDVLELDV